MQNEKLFKVEQIIKFTVNRAIRMFTLLALPCFFCVPKCSLYTAGERGGHGDDSGERPRGDSIHQCHQKRALQDSHDHDEAVMMELTYRRVSYGVYEYDPWVIIELTYCRVSYGVYECDPWVMRLSGTKVISPGWYSTLRGVIQRSPVWYYRYGKGPGRVRWVAGLGKTNLTRCLNPALSWCSATT